MSVLKGARLIRVLWEREDRALEVGADLELAAEAARVLEAPREVQHVDLLLVGLVEGVEEALLQNDVARRARELAAAPAGRGADLRLALARQSSLLVQVKAS